MRVVLAVAALAVLGACASAPEAKPKVAAATAAPSAATAAAAKPAKVKCTVASGLGSNMKKKECATTEQRADPSDKDGSRDEARRFQRALAVDEANGN